MSLSTLVVTKELLDKYYTLRNIYYGKPRRWHKRYVPDWIEDNIIRSAEWLREGESIDEIIDWVDPKTKTEGNRFENKDVFFEAMNIAYHTYGMRNIPYKKLNFMTLNEALQILSEYRPENSLQIPSEYKPEKPGSKGTPASKLVKKYNLYNQGVVYNLEKNLKKRLEKLFSCLITLKEMKDISEQKERLSANDKQQFIITPDTAKEITYAHRQL